MAQYESTALKVIRPESPLKNPVIKPPSKERGKGVLPQAILSAREELKGQKALVTGASSGIGRAIAIALAQAGADVVVNYHSDRKEAERVVDLIQRSGRKAYSHKADISKESQVKSMFKRMLENFKTIDILVNNAGIQKDRPITRMSLEDWEDVIKVNLTGCFLCTREVVKIMKRHKGLKNVSSSFGKIIFISSVHEIIPWAGHVNYAASKAGVMMLMKSVAQEVAPLGIRVNSVAPGAIRTRINQDVWANPKKNKKLMKLIPYQKIGRPEDVGKAVVWLSSDDSDYVTGETLYIDGGMTLYPGFQSGQG